MGKHDMYGLGDFGDDFGGVMDEGWFGAAVGGGVGTGTSMVLRMVSANPTLRKYSDGIGALAGAAAGAVMAFGMNKPSGKVAMATALVTGGLRQLEVLMGGGLAGFGLPTIEPTRAFGIATIENTRAFGNNMPQLVGPPQLVGAGGSFGNGAAASQVALNGGPPISGLASAYGATLFG